MPSTHSVFMPEQYEGEEGARERKIDELVEILVEEYPELLSDVLGKDVTELMDDKPREKAKSKIRRRMRELLILLMEKEDT